MDEYRLQLVDFSYNGQGPDVFFYVGQEGDPSESDGRKIPDELGRESVLQEYKNENIILNLPSNLPVSSLLWISVWCRLFRVDFGSLILPHTPSSIPAPVVLPSGLSTKSHGVTSGPITLLDERRMHISELVYDGEEADAYFWGSMTDVPDENGFIISNSDDISEGALTAYNGEDVIIVLPEGKTWGAGGVRSFSIWCKQCKENFGDVLTNEDYLLPPYIEEQGMSVLANCETVNKHMNVAWEVMDDHIVVEMMAAIEYKAGYMAFGVSGADDYTAMVGGDVAIASFNDDGSANVEDYFLQGRAYCSGTTGVCPDNKWDDNNQCELVNAWRMDGISTVRYKKPLITGETETDRNIVTDEERYFIWALGSLNSQGLVTKHTDRGGVKLELTRPAIRSCEPITELDVRNVTGWSNEIIRIDETPQIDVTIGPTGGKKGYEAITHQQSWGVALYLNGILIPTVVAKRGDTVTFKVHEGDSDENSAEYHPFYITDDPVGGYSAKSEAEKDTVTVLAGPANGSFCEYKITANTSDPETYDTFQEYAATLTLECAKGSPGILVWTPDTDTPDTVYYQCYSHQYLGWKIIVVDNYNDYFNDTVTAGARALAISCPHIFSLFITMATSLYFTE